MAKSKLRSTFKTVVTALVSIVFLFAGLLICLIISQFLQSNEFSFLSIGITVGSIAIGLILSTITHNFAHYLVGNIFHYRLISYDFNEIIMIPAKKESSATRQAIYYAAGIVCNLILGIALLLVLFLAPLKLPTIILLFLVAVSFIWIITAGIQAVSYYSDGIPTDGKVLWGLLFHSDFSKYYTDNTNLFSALKIGLRPAEIPMRSYSNDAELQATDSLLVLYLYYKALDVKKASVLIKYVKLLEDNLTVIPQSIHDTVICELCYANAVMGLQQQATSYFSLMKQLPAESRSMPYYRALAAYFFYCKTNCKQALLSVSYAMEMADSCEFKGMLDLEQELLQTLLQEIAEEI